MIGREDHEAVRTALTSPATYGTTLHAVFLEHYGEQVYGWEPETLSMELWDDFRVQISAEPMDKWLAIQTALANDGFFSSVSVFSAVCNTLASGAPSFQVFDPLTVEEIAWAVTEVGLNRDVLRFAPSIRKYVRLVLEMDGEASGDHPAAVDYLLDPDADTGPADAARAVLYGANAQTADAMVSDELAGLTFQLGKFRAFTPIEKVLALRAQ